METKLITLAEQAAMEIVRNRAISLETDLIDTIAIHRWTETDYICVTVYCKGPKPLAQIVYRIAEETAVLDHITIPSKEYVIHGSRLANDLAMERGTIDLIGRMAHMVYIIETEASTK